MPSLAELILEKSIPEPNSGCWLWVGTPTEWGAMIGCSNHAIRARLRMGWAPEKAISKRLLERRDLTDRQKEVLTFVFKTIIETGIPPTFREIGHALSIDSTNAVADHVDALVGRGVLARTDRSSRNIALVVEAA